jgi:hypothetical protein
MHLACRDRVSESHARQLLSIDFATFIVNAAQPSREIASHPRRYAGIEKSIPRHRDAGNPSRMSKT